MSVTNISALAASAASSSAVSSTAISSTAALTSGTSSGDTTTVSTLPDGATVTTVRDKEQNIVSITTTPPTRPPGVFHDGMFTGATLASAGSLNGGIDVSA